MNTTSDFDGRAAAWLADGPTELNDRVLEAALREVHLTRQRRRLSTPWRSLPMSMLPRQLVAAALVAAVAVAGVLVLANRTNVGAPPATLAPSTAASPAATASRVAATELPEGDLTGLGPWQSRSFDIALTFQTPKAGWRVMMDTPGSVILASATSTIQFIHVLAGARSCSSPQLWSPWKPGDPSTAPDSLRDGGRSPFATDPAHAFAEYLRYRLEPYAKARPDGALVLGSDQSARLGGNDGVAIKVVNGLVEKAVASCPFGIIPIAQFATDNWFGIDTAQHGTGGGAYRITSVATGAALDTTLLVVIQPPAEAGATLDPGRLALAETEADVVLATVTFP